MINADGHDWAAVIGADLETGDPPVAYVCQACARVLPAVALWTATRSTWTAPPRLTAGDLFGRIKIT